jgi:hypothetical protein
MTVLARLRRQSLRLLAPLAVVLASGVVMNEVSTRTAEAWSFGASTTEAFAIEGFAGTGPEGTGSSRVLEDASGNIFVVGATAGTIDVDSGPGTTLVGDGVTDAVSYVAKFSPTGAFLWAHDWKPSGSSELWIYSADVGPGGYIILGGEVSATSGMDLDPTSGVDPVTAARSDPFLLRLNADGTYGWGSSFLVTGGGTGNIPVLEVSSTGSIVTGISYENTLTLFGTPITSAGNPDVAIVQFDAAASAVTWLTTVRGTGNDWVTSMDVASNGKVYISGGFTSSSVTVTGSDTSMTTMTLSGSAVQNSYFASFSSEGLTQYAVRSSVGSVDSLPRSVALSSSGILLTQLDTGELVEVSTGGAITSKGTIGGNILGMEYIASGAVIAVGKFNTVSDFDPSSGVQNGTPAGGDDGFVLRLTSTFAFDSLQVFSTASLDEVNSLSLSTSGGYLVSGRSLATSLNLSNTDNPGTYTRSGSADGFVFVIRYDTNGTTGVPTTTTTSTTTTTTTIATAPTTTTIAPAATTTVPAVLAPSSATYSTGNKKVTVKWSAVSGAASYNVSSSSGSILCTSAASSCVVSSLKNGKLYSLTVKSVNSVGVSSVTGATVKVIPGFSLKTTSYKVKKSPLLTSIVATPSKGIRRWQKVSGGCVLRSGRLVAPKTAGTCRVKLSVSKRSSYPAMTTTVTVTITK